jgi:hypothetical protein
MGKEKEASFLSSAGLVKEEWEEVVVPSGCVDILGW